MQPSARSSDGFERVCRVHDLAPGRLVSHTLADGERVCVGNHGGTLFAVRDQCPHQHFPLSDGELRADGLIECARHGAAFDCHTGRAVRGPVRGRGEREEPLGRLVRCELRIADGDLFVRAPAPDF